MHKWTDPQTDDEGFKLQVIIAFCFLIAKFDTDLL